MRRAGVGYDASMRAWRIFAVFALVAAMGVAQTAIDPYTFAGRIGIHNAELNELWQTLGISAKIRETTVGGSKDTDKIFDCAEDDRCEANCTSSAWSSVMTAPTQC